MFITYKCHITCFLRRWLAEIEINDKIYLLVEVVTNINYKVHYNLTASYRK